MTDYALWDVSPTSLPGGSTSFGGPTSLATLFKVTASNLYLKGYRYYCLDANQTAVNARFAAWTATGATTGTLLSGSAQTAPSLTVSLTTPNDVLLATPVPLTSGQVYAAVAGDAAFGPITSGYWTGSAAGAAGITNGPLVGFSDTTGSAPDSLGNHQGLFQQVSNDPTAAFPATAFSSSNFWISPIVTDDPSGFSVDFVSTDGNGVSTYNVAAQENNTGSPGAQPMRVLPPSSPSPSYPHGFLIMLPVEPGQGTTFGDSIGTIVSLGAHNTYNLTCIQPGYATHPWYADNPGDTSTQQETFLLNLVTWIKANLASSGTEDIYLIGFSSSGLGGQGLQFRHPDIFKATASWDAPFVMTDYNGTDPNGTVGGSSSLVYGTSSNFTSNYELSTGNLTAWKAPFTDPKRIWLGGYSAFQADTTQYDARLTSVGIAHTLGTMSSTTHAWQTGWVAEALATIIQAGIAHTVGASLTVTPTFSAGRTRGWVRQASLSVQPVFQAVASQGQVLVRAAALAITPSFLAGRVRGRTRSAALSVTPVLHVAGTASNQPLQTLTLSAESKINVYDGMELEVTIEMNVGAPYQGNISSLATDRWYAMYPS